MAALAPPTYPTVGNDRALGWRCLSYATIKLSRPSLRWSDWNDVFGRTSALPQPVLHIALEIDSERTFAWNLQRRVRNERTLRGCRIYRRFDVVNEPVRSNDGGLSIPQGSAHANAAPIREWSRPRASKKRIS